jgi:hypothetical protein
LPGNHGSIDAIITRFDADGNLVWAPKVDSIHAPLSTLYLKQKTSYQLVIAAFYKNTVSSGKITFKSSNTKVLTVSATGKLTAKAVKKSTKVTVTVKSGTKSKKLTVYVVPKGKSVSAKASVPGTLKVGAYGWATASAGKGTNVKVTFSSSKSSVVAVDKYGKLAGRAKGKATITVKVGSKKVKKTITVK